MNELSLKKSFLGVVIASLSISAIFGIFVFLSGSFGRTEERVLEENPLQTKSLLNIITWWNQQNSISG